MALSNILLPSTLPELLQARAAVQGPAQLTFLHDDASVLTAISYADLFDVASVYARRLLSAGLTPSDIVLASFPDHESHIYLFWACCLAGIPFCPLPALHPDPSRQSMLFNHLQSLFHKPTLVASASTIQGVQNLVPELKALVLDDLPVANVDTLEGIFPVREPSPNDIVCFMLTSGSTGNSKAVSLRHSNLLSSIRGKIRHHGTTTDSRFLNWIAFDHVACVSEVHLQALEANSRSAFHLLPHVGYLTLLFSVSGMFRQPPSSAVH
jgi:acyl-CoA synthetase (AMP-forming)/AMP-acid ligase II